MGTLELVKSILNGEKISEEDIHDEIKKNIFFEDWGEIIKAHKYSRKEFRDGRWIYYYDKHNNYARISRCKNKALVFNTDNRLPDELQISVLKDQAIEYIENNWLSDWEKPENSNKSICKELRNKKIVFEDISYEHLWKQGGNSNGGSKIRDPNTFINHAKYLPCAKELLENNGVWTSATYEKLNNPYTENVDGIRKKVIANVYQVLAGLNPNPKSNGKYILVTISKKQYEDRTYSNTEYISVAPRSKLPAPKIKKSTGNIPCFNISKVVNDRKPIGSGQHTACHTDKKSISQNKIKSMPTVNKSILHDDVTINIKDVTVGNRQAKIDCLEKSFTGKLNYGKALVEYVEKDDTPVLKDLITLRIARFDKNKIDKAVRTLSFSLDTELKAPKGEAFTYKAQEDLTNVFVKELTEKTKELYTMIISYFGLPEMRILTKANLIYKGKVVYSPETGKPISEKDWAKFVDALEKFLNRNYKGIGKRIVLSADALGRILDRLTDTKKLEEIKKLRLDELKYKGKKLEWISNSVKNMTDTFGESLSRIQQAKIQVMTQSAAQRVTNVTDKMRGDIQQILIDGVKNHQSKSQVSQALFDKCVGLNRDFQRIADTEIQNATNEAYVNDAVYNAKEGEKVYFKRYEVLDGNTCKKCESLKGKIALWSDVPLGSQNIQDEYADIAIWEGCGLMNKDGIPIGTAHPWCRGHWRRYFPDTMINEE